MQTEHLTKLQVVLREMEDRAEEIRQVCKKKKQSLKLNKNLKNG